MPLSKARDRERKRLAKQARLENGFVEISSCEVCEWVGVCDIHHRDRDRQNNNIENLQVLCPNCHRNIHRKEFQPSSDLNTNSQFQPNIPLYNPSSHRIGDRVLVYKGKRLVETVIPQIDADGNPIYEEG